MTWISTGGRLTARNADVGLHSGQSLRLSMSTESQLREKLRKIEALFAGAGTAGERLAAEAALERVRARLGELSRQDPSIEMQFSMPDQWSRHLFLALCRRYGMKPYRYYRQRRNTVMIRAPKRFLDQVLWPEFSELDQALQAYLHRTHPTGAVLSNGWYLAKRVTLSLALRSSGDAGRGFGRVGAAAALVAG